jgi:intracellular sulfur oxidation DsrE/DsrF family protein
MWGLTAVLATVFSIASMAQDEKPFAEQKIVLQISDMDPFKQTLVLNNASNIIKYYGPDQVDVEIVAFGPGLRLLFEENSNAGRIEGLTESGVRFAACANTVANMSKTLGHKLELNENAKVVPGGIVRIKELVDQGYVLIKP